MVPPIEGLLQSSSVSNDSLDAMVSQFESITASNVLGHAESRLESTSLNQQFAHEQHSQAQTETAYHAVFDLIKKEEGGKVSAKDWNTGLSLIPAPGTGKSAWVSEEGKAEFLAKGDAAIKNLVV